MPRERFQTLTEQMFYVLLCLQTERCGIDIMERVHEITDDRISIGAGTLYHLLESFLEEELIVHTKTEGRKRSYIITEHGLQRLEEEYKRLQMLVLDYERVRALGGLIHGE